MPAGTLRSSWGRLKEQGYRFHVNDAGSNRSSRSEGRGRTRRKLAIWLEERLGGFPLVVVSSWLHLVGDVWLVGTHPVWRQSSSADPLVIELEGGRYPNTSIRQHPVRLMANTDTSPGIPTPHRWNAESSP